MNCAAPSLAYIFAGKGVVLENSRVTCPSQPGSNGVTFTIMPHLAYVDLPKQITITLSGILKYSTVLAKAKEFGGYASIIAGGFKTASYAKQYEERGARGQYFTDDEGDKIG